MQRYGKAAAEAIIGDNCRYLVEIKEDGVWPIVGPEAFLQWKPCCELEGPDAPDPTEAPSLPIPFSASELAAFMLSGAGAFVVLHFGKWKNGPAQSRLRALGVQGNKAREAVRAAYDEYRAAEREVGPLDRTLEAQVEQLADEYEQVQQQAFEAEGCNEANITQEERLKRRSRASKSILGFTRRLQSSQERSSIAKAAWVKAMVNRLLGERTEMAPELVPVVDVSASREPVGPLPLPLPLTSGDIAFCFAGLRWETEAAWKKPLGDQPKWLAACVHTPGVRGVSETRWNPVLIGAELVRRGHVKVNSVRAKFQTMSHLKPWLETWKTYEADNFDTE